MDQNFQLGVIGSRVLLEDFLVNLHAAFHVPGIDALAADLRPRPTEKDAAVVREFAASALGDRLLAFGIENVGVNFVSFEARRRGRGIVGSHHAGDRLAGPVENVDVLAGRLFDREVGEGERSGSR